MSKYWLDGIMGFVVADALGVPVEFSSREERRLDPVKEMRAYGTYDQPMGTWSDDSSMTLATVDSIKHCGGIDYKDLMDRFASWKMRGDYTPFQEVFDMGISTSYAINRYMKGESPLACGGKDAQDNGNGSLMRILPVCLYLYDRQKTVCTSEDESIYLIHNVSALTHGHLRSQLACGMYYFMVKAILDKNEDLLSRLQAGMDSAYKYYRKDMSVYRELGFYERLIDLTQFKDVAEDEIKSSGYVLDTLEAVVWCLINTESYKDAVLKAVNLGKDTDTVAAIAGGLAGLYYGCDGIPEEWKTVIQKKEWIEELVGEM